MDYCCVFILLWKLCGLPRPMRNCLEHSATYTHGFTLFSFVPFPPPHPVFPPRILNPGASPSVSLTLWSATLRPFTATWPSTFCPLSREATWAVCSTTTPYWTLRGVSLTSTPPSNQTPMSNCSRSFELLPTVRLALFFLSHCNADGTTTA